MPSTAILIGNAEYSHGKSLPCCREDVAAMQALLKATGRFDHIHVHIDLNADEMRSVVRDAVPPEGGHGEVLFYFSGHGGSIGGELYLCGTNFEASRPNETGFRYGDLIDLFRGAMPELLVTVIDACYSGALLIKSEQNLIPVEKNGLRNVLQFSSSLQNQGSLGGDLLSAFTAGFVEASLRKTDGVVYYTDIISTLRDDFMNSNDQIPFFVNQGTGREILVDDARKLANFRDEFNRRWRDESDENGEGEEEAGDSENDEIDVTGPLTPKQLLIAAEERMGGPIEAERFINSLFDGVVGKFSESEFAEFFDVSTIEHENYVEPVIRDFMIRALSREIRPDRMVTAEIKRKQKKINPIEQAVMGVAMALGQEWTEHFTLELNCSMSRAQLKLTLTPKYKSLQQLQLVLSCAPSLNQCYVFEMVTQHPRIDWDAFDVEGREVVRRWHSREWDADVGPLVAKVCDALTNAVREHIDGTTKRLAGD